MNSPASLRILRVSPTRTSRAALARCPLDSIRPISQDFWARARVLKKRAAQSHLSIRTEVRADSILSIVLYLSESQHLQQLQARYGAPIDDILNGNAFTTKCGQAVWAADSLSGCQLANHRAGKDGA